MRWTRANVRRWCARLAYEKIYDAWYNKVRGQNPNTFFGIYDVVRWDTVWVG